MTSSGSLVLGRRVSVPLNMRALGSACGRVDVVAGAPLALVDATIWDDAGALVASAEGSSSVTLFACPKGPSAHLELETRGRPGPFTVMLRQERWKDAVFVAHPLAAARMLSRAAQGPDMLHDGKELAARGHTLDGAHVSTWSETVPAGKCLTTVAGAEGEGTGLILRVADETSGEELDRSHAANAAGVRACAPSDAARKLKLELRASSGKLETVVGERVSP
jgi:hypothetical protein